MPPALRKFTLAVHLTVSVGWVGAVAGYIALDVTAATGRDTDTLRFAFLGMERIAVNVIVPLALASLPTGLIVSLGTKWGLFRHYWLLISLVLTTLATLVLLSETRVISAYADMAADPTTTSEELRGLGSTLVHSVGGTLVLLVILVLNVYKPRGLTRYGWRKQQEERRVTPQAGRDSVMGRWSSHASAGPLVFGSLWCWCSSCWPSSCSGI